MVATSFMSCAGKSDNKNQDSTQQGNDSTSNKTQAGLYVNQKYGFSIKYPDQNFELKEMTDTGVVFESKDGKATLKVHLGNLTGTITDLNDFRTAYDQDSQDKGKRKVTYKSFKVNNYILMGYEVKTIFYQKTIITKGVFATAILTYDDAAKDTYYPMIEPIFKSFK